MQSLDFSCNKELEHLLYLLLLHSGLILLVAEPFLACAPTDWGTGQNDLASGWAWVRAGLALC